MGKALFDEYDDEVSKMRYSLRSEGAVCHSEFCKHRREIFCVPRIILERLRHFLDREQRGQRISSSDEAG